MRACGLLGVVLSLVICSSPAWAQVQAAGASFPSKVYARWAQRFQDETRIQVHYKPTGSGDGVKRITERSVMFAGTDTPLSPQELSKRQLVQLPTVVGGIVPVVNLPGVEDGELQLDGTLLAEIMLGGIDRWDHPRIAELNRKTRLPALPIKRVVRADRSGTTEGFTRYLGAVAPVFQQQVGVSQQPAWPGSVHKADGNDGVSATLKATPGGIGYVSYDRVAADGLSGVRLRNQTGRFVKASEAGFRSAISESGLARGDDLASLMDRPGPDTWPITLVSFVLFDAQPKAAAEVTPALRFLYWCFMNGDHLTKGTGFAPLPTSVQARLANRFATVKAQDGGPIGYSSF